MLPSISAGGLEDGHTARHIIVGARPRMIEVAGVVDDLVLPVRALDLRRHELVMPFLVAGIDPGVEQNFFTGSEPLLQLACLTE